MTSIYMKRKLSRSWVSALHIYHEPGFFERISKIVKFFGLTDYPQIITIGKGSTITEYQVRNHFPRCQFFWVEDEFEGYHKACETAINLFPESSLLLANDSLARHWYLSWFRRSWFLSALNKASSISQDFIVLSEKHFGRPHKFPGSGGPEQWYTSNYFCTDNPKFLLNAISIAMVRSQEMPNRFRERGEPAVRWLFRKRGIPITRMTVENKLQRTWTEMCLYHSIEQSGLSTFPASRGRSLPNLLHKFVDS